MIPRHIVDTKYFRIFIFGNFATVEVDVGRRGSDLAFFFVRPVYWKFNLHSQWLCFAFRNYMR